MSPLMPPMSLLRPSIEMPMYSVLGLFSRVIALMMRRAKLLPEALSPTITTRGSRPATLWQGIAAGSSPSGWK